MKLIQTSNGRIIELPNDWSEVPAKSKINVWREFMHVLDGTSSIYEWQVYTLIEITGYKPGRAMKKAIRKYSPVHDLTLFSFLRLAEQLTFPFELDSSGEIVRDTDAKAYIRYEMLNSPFPCKVYFDRTKQFITTNLTAGQYVECLELVQFISKTQDPMTCLEATCKLCNILGLEYKSKILKNVTIAQTAIVMWFTGIATYFQYHPVYRLLYAKPIKSDTIDGGNSITPVLNGAREALMQLEQNGYAEPERMNVEKYFDAQIMMLKDNLRKALYDGVKRPDLCRQTGLMPDDLKALGV